MLAWNNAEAGKILETYKIYENKPPDMIMEKTGTQVNFSFIFRIYFLLFLQQKFYHHNSVDENFSHLCKASKNPPIWNFYDTFMQARKKEKS